MAGLTQYGPVPYQLVAPRVTMVPRPTLVSSFTEFERAFGSLEPVGADADTINYLAYAARAFFDNGGRRLYVSRVFPFTLAVDGSIDVDKNFAKLTLPGAGGPGTWRARWPGAAGAGISVQVTMKRSKNLVVGGASAVLRGVSPGAAVEIVPNRAQIPPDTTAPTALRTIARGPDGRLGYLKPDGTVEAVTDNGVIGVCHITVAVTIRFGDVRTDVYTGLELDSGLVLERLHARSILRVLSAERPIDDLSLVWLDVFAGATAPTPLDLLTGLLTLATPTFLAGGGDGDPLSPDALLGEESDPDDASKAATGLEALGEIDDIAIVATPDSVRFATDDAQRTAVQNLIRHCEAARYRIGVVDPPSNRSISGVREFRSQFDTTYAALYYPWVEILDPTAKNDPGAAPATLQLPPSGLVAGIYARSDIARGVHKAPANEVVFGMTRFMQNVTFDRQSVLNPEGINALRFFPGRSNRVWGARTMSSDPEWKYVNVRRLFIYLEHSIDKSTQWSVFEPNNESLWSNVRQTITDFLIATWRTGALMGTRPEEAFFVRCDRTTMTQNDLDNGRLVCLIGVAPTYPAEFVIFRIGQWTADAQQS
jgi:hypothetical protein